MGQKILVWSLLLSYFSRSFESFIPKRKQINIFTESQCKDTIKLFDTSVKESINFPDIENMVDIKFIPFGNGNLQSKNTDGTWTFTCQHGEVECYGNQLEVCALDMIDGYQKQAKFLVCLHAEKKRTIEEYDYDAKKCLSNHLCGFNKVKQCMNVNNCFLFNIRKSKEGKYLQYKAAIQTKASKVFYVPYITVDGVHDYNTEFSIKDSLVKWLCQSEFQGVDFCQDIL